MLEKARSSISDWRKAGCQANQISNVLYGIVVDFGEGDPRPWSTWLSPHLKSRGPSSANTILKSIDGTIAKLDSSTITSHFTSLKGISGLGKDSYASKVLRCLSENHVVFDRRIQQELGVKTYQDFRLLCEQIATALGVGFSPADVEGGLFVWVQLLLPPKMGHHRWKKYKIKTSCLSGVKPTNPPPNPPFLDIVKEPLTDGSCDKRILYLCQNHRANQAVTLKEDCSSNWNLGWICRSHGCLDFKNNGARGTTRYLAGEIIALGGDVVGHANYNPSINGATCHQGGNGYLGGVTFGSVATAVRYLKQYFTVVACAYNKTETQAWIDAQ